MTAAHCSPGTSTSALGTNTYRKSSKNPGASLYFNVSPERVEVAAGG